jgi:hypothetical protein
LIGARVEDRRLALQEKGRCITKKYMAATAVITVRIDPDLLAALKAKALQEGRTVSAEVVYLVRREVGRAPRRSKSRSRSTMGMFPDFDAPDLDEMIALRREASRSLKRRRKRA